MTPGENQAAAGRGAGIEIVPMPEELDLTTSAGAAAQGCAAVARLARLVLLDLAGVSFCDARGLSAFVKITNQADAAGCVFGLIAPRPPVAKILRISGLDSRMPVFATTGDTLALRTASATVWAPGTRRSTGGRSAAHRAGRSTFRR
jgi:anti-anti-sigma factor